MQQGVPGQGLGAVPMSQVEILISPLQGPHIPAYGVPPGMGDVPQQEHRLF